MDRHEPNTHPENPRFSAIDMEGLHGPTCYVPDPKRAAYLQCAMIQNMMGLSYALTCHEDGCFTVETFGQMPLTFAPETQH